MSSAVPRIPASLDLSEREHLIEFPMIYHRPPNRTSTIPTKLISVTPGDVVWLNSLSPKEPIRFDGKVVMDRGYWAVWFIGQGDCYDTGKVYSADGQHTGYYLDVLEPVRWTGSDITTLQPLTDLFLDIWQAPDGRFEVLDEPEFLEAQQQGWLTSQQIASARQTLTQLIARAKSGTLIPPAVAAFELRFAHDG